MMMRHRKRPNRQPSDAERIDAANHEARTLAAAGDMAGARKALRKTKEVATGAQLARETYAARGVLHPMRKRQLALEHNERARRYPLLLKRRPVPPHPTQREERIFARLMRTRDATRADPP
jgi:hypothetical protein